MVGELAFMYAISPIQPELCFTSLAKLLLKNGFPNNIFINYTILCAVNGFCEKTLFLFLINVT